MPAVKVWRLRFLEETKMILDALVGAAFFAMIVCVLVIPWMGGSNVHAKHD